MRKIEDSLLRFFIDLDSKYSVSKSTPFSSNFDLNILFALILLLFIGANLMTNEVNHRNIPRSFLESHKVLWHVV